MKQLPNDVARCTGVGRGDDGWREGCEDCRRRTSLTVRHADRLVWMTPPSVIVFECHYRIEPGERA